MLGACALGAWLCGRVLNDRWLWSQLLWWMPGVVLLPAVVVVWALGWAFRRLPRRSANSGARRGVGIGGVVRLLGWAALLGGVADLCARDHHFWRSAGDGSARGAIRIVHWNAGDSAASDWPKRVLAEAPDIVALVPTSGHGLAELVDGMGPGALPIYERGIAFFSRLPVRAYGYASLNIEPAMNLDPRNSGGRRLYADPGRAMYVVLDASTRIGRDLVVWFVDLPSDPSLSREMSCAEAARAIAAFSGPEESPDGDGKWTRRIEGVNGFPAPDIVVGDFNTPKGSRSIRHLAGGLVDASAAVGGGYSATFPRRRPLWHIDQAFVARSLKPVGYRLVDFSSGTHIAQSLDVSAAATH
jgi:hypothetical protein